MLTNHAAVAQSDYLPRNNYGAKFEPLDGILHGAGQVYYRDLLPPVCQSGCLSEAAEQYTDVLGPTRTPLLFMDYNNKDDGASWYAGLNDRIEVFETNYDRQLVPQLGTVLPTGNTLLTQTQINNVVSGLASLNRPVYYRPGYEANGPWNNYNAGAFISNFRALSDAIRDAELPVAMVWNVVVGDGGNYSQWNNSSINSAEDYYPGDEYVDWWSFNNFGTVTFDNSFWNNEVSQFLAEADAEGFPVLLGEATPQFVGAEDASDWNTWFDKFFDRIQNNPGIKAHTYINWDWGDTVEWPNWGDASLENAHSTVRNNYISELSDPIYVHSDSILPGFLDLLGDYNGDGYIDGADYTVWKDLLDIGATVMPNDPTPGVIDSTDFGYWVLHFGEGTPPGAGSGAGAGIVPEPASLALLALGLVLLASLGRNRPRAGLRFPGLLVPWPSPIAECGTALRRVGVRHQCELATCSFLRRMCTPPQVSDSRLDAEVDATEATLRDGQMRSVCQSAELSNLRFLAAGNYSAARNACWRF